MSFYTLDFMEKVNLDSNLTVQDLVLFRVFCCTAQLTCADFIFLIVLIIFLQSVIF